MKHYVLVGKADGSKRRLCNKRVGTEMEQSLGRVPSSLPHRPTLALFSRLTTRGLAAHIYVGGEPSRIHISYAIWRWNPGGFYLLSDFELLSSSVKCGVIGVW